MYCYAAVWGLELCDVTDVIEMSLAVMTCCSALSCCCLGTGLCDVIAMSWQCDNTLQVCGHAAVWGQGFVMSLMSLRCHGDVMTCSALSCCCLGTGDL